MIVKTPKPPYYAVIFTSVLNENISGYSETASVMEELVKKQEGFLGIESARGKVGITISYWKDLESIENWKNNLQHSLAKQKGKSEWYQSFKTRIAYVEKDY